MLSKFAILPLLISLAGSAVGAPMDPSLVARKESAVDLSGGDLAAAIKAALQQAKQGKQAAVGQADGTGTADDGTATADAASSADVATATDSAVAASGNGGNLAAAIKTALQQALQGAELAASQAAAAQQAAATATADDGTAASSAAASTATDAAGVAADGTDGTDVSANATGGGSAEAAASNRETTVSTATGAAATDATGAAGVSKAAKKATKKAAKQAAAAPLSQRAVLGSTQCNVDRLNIVAALAGAVNAVNAITPTNSDTAAVVTAAQANLISAAAGTMAISLSLVAGQNPPASAAEQVGKSFADAQTALTGIHDPTVNATLTDAQNKLTTAIQAGNAINADCD
ncbi:hypothetical protein B0H16DRAFT_1893341 [Mycena metata]|uniref:Uncharacterized protein n=1 Tax=Mycena metata TaxID=1033252 RepID=A0AAD7HZ33_9AGAR|nr:hypothetical protein B0H16DRAFT_1893341 [Mycena metata]